MILGHNMLSRNVKHRWFNSIPFWDSGKMLSPKTRPRSGPDPTPYQLCLSGGLFFLFPPGFFLLTTTLRVSSHTPICIMTIFMLLSFKFLSQTPNLLLSSIQDIWPERLIDMSKTDLEILPPGAPLVRGGPCLSEWYPVYPSSRISFFPSWSHSSALL